MGWTWYHAAHYKRGGAVDRKAECDSYFQEGLNSGFYKVLKSAMVGSTYYAAVRNLKECVGRDEDGKRIYKDAKDAPVWAAVFLTQTNIRDSFNFGYKDMAESMFPCEVSCPMSILKLLSPTDDENTMGWRNACMKTAEAKKSPRALVNLPVGTKIQFVLNGVMTQFVKSGPCFQFKRPFWYNIEGGTYIPARRIPDNYEILE